MSAMGQTRSKLKKNSRMQYMEPQMTYKVKQDSNATSVDSSVNIHSDLVPQWIHKSLFIEIVRENVPRYSRIEKFSVTPAINAVDNYSSLMLRVSIVVTLIDNTPKTLSFIMKVPHESAKMQQMLKTVNFFTVENATYSELITKFERLYRDKGLNIKFAPRTFKFRESIKIEPKLRNTVLMHDLAQDGYRNKNRLECLNFEETKLVLLKLAQYHAAGAQCRALYGPYSDVFTQPIFGPNRDRALTILEGIMGPFKKMFMEHLSEFQEGHKYYEKFAILFSKMSQKYLALSTYDIDEFNVINHGDCWINNILFKYESNGNLNDLLFVDFQLPKYGHPSTDLLNFIMTSVNIEHKLKDFDYFIKYYHDQLIKHLYILDYTHYMPTLKELHMQLYKYGIWAIVASVMVLPIVLMDPNDETNECTHFKNQLYTNARYKSNIELILPWLDNRGLLEA